jgi:Flp pilus assembly protein TadD
MESGLEYLKKKEIDKLSTQTEELKAELAEFRTSKGIALASQGKYDEAVKAYDEAIRLDPNYAKAWYNKGVAIEALGKTTEANAAFTNAKELGYTD